MTDDEMIFISIHALLAESDYRVMCYIYNTTNISIHALLAESDRVIKAGVDRLRYFYPRSPCGERRATCATRRGAGYFYPRSPCGERRVRAGF